MASGLWKSNWDETRRRFLAWWDHQGLVLGTWGTGLPRVGDPWEPVSAPPLPTSLAERHTDPDYVARRVHFEMAGKEWPADMLPVAWPDVGTVCLAPYLGAMPGYEVDRVWYAPGIVDPETARPLRFDAANQQVHILESVVRETVRRGGGRYLVGMPALVPNLDVLAELRGTEALLFDMIDRPEWVERAREQIDEAWMTAFDRMYDIVRMPDGSMAFGYFMLWGPGRVGLLQCDCAATFSPSMFERFVVPGLRRECRFLDRSMFHLDGHQCLGHLDHLLSIETLDAIEWTPDPKVPPGGDPHWHAMYRTILAAGKSVWIAGATPDQVAPLLDAIGSRGVYLTVNVASVAEMESVARAVEPYR